MAGPVLGLIQAVGALIAARQGTNYDTVASQCSPPHPSYCQVIRRYV